MTTTRPKDSTQLPGLLSGIYFGIAVLCAVLFFIFGEAIQSISYLILVALTLPWSLVAILLSWGLAPAGKWVGVFVLICLIFAGFNAGIIYWLSRKLFGRTSDEET